MNTFDHVKKTLSVLLLFLLFASFLMHSTSVKAQNYNKLLVLQSGSVYSPFDIVTVVTQEKGLMQVTDAKGKVYVSQPVTNLVSFEAGGALGEHTVTLFDKKGKPLTTATFTLAAATKLDDGGPMHELFTILKNGMLREGKNGYGQVKWRGQYYKYYVPWDLDNNNVLNGIQYFLPYGAEFTDLLRETQREDGMIWSFVSTDLGNLGSSVYYKTAYEPIGFFRDDEEAFFVRQPVDNHSDYNYVNQFYKHWKASGDNVWMKKTLESAASALDYCYTDSIRWSKRFQLLKRPYCIDSWDFQVDDEYTPYAPVAPTMVLVPGKTKYGVFFGDNTGYYEACNQLSEMYEYAGQQDRAKVYKQRGQQILDNLLKLSWNGRFFTHYIDEDPTVKRNLGVDERSQIAQGNMYSVNRGLPREVNQAIIKTYMALRDSLPAGSPGEWYAIIPPFEKGFGLHGSKWQYMNGGVAGHAIGELARGAYENGFEEYATDILFRMLDLAKKHNDKVYFSYTGSIPPPPPSPTYRTLNILGQANMDLWDSGGNTSLPWMNESRKGNDMRGIPTGEQVFDGIKFQVIDPALNKRKAAISVSNQPGFSNIAEIPVNDYSSAIYLLHSISGVGSSQIAGAITLIYTDGTSFSKYIQNNKDISNWWFPSLKTPRAGVAWHGPNAVSEKVGVCWNAIDNPNPDKKIAKIRIQAPVEDGIYAVLGITLSNMSHYVAPLEISHGGPDNWTAGNGMGALVEGLAGVKNLGLAFDTLSLTPRWPVSKSDSASVVIRFAASNGYVAYNYTHDAKSRTIQYKLTGSGNEMQAKFLLPKGVGTVSRVTVNNMDTQYTLGNESSDFTYVNLNLELTGVHDIEIQYSN